MKSSCKVKNPESENPFPRILCKESKRIQNPFCKESSIQNPLCKESRIQNLLWRIHPACCWVTADGRRNDEQEEGTRTRWGARWGSGDSRPRDSRRWADPGALELFRISSTLLLWWFARKKLTWLVWALANPVAARIVVTSHEDVAIGAFLSWASDLGSLSPNDLCVMTASIVIQACVGVVVVPVALIHPLLHRFPWLPVLAYSPEDVLAVRPAWMLQSAVSILQSFHCPVVCECGQVVVPN